MVQVSVVIPAYNSMAYLPETVANVLEQTYGDFELIIVNDGSTDNTEAWIKQLTDPRIKLISQENRGLAGARNTGISKAQGEYIAFIDADDLWHPDKLTQQVKVLDAHPDVGLVYTWVTYISDDGTSTGRTVKPQAEGMIWQQLIAVNQIECGSVAMIRRACFERVGLFDPPLRSYGEDWDMWLRLSLHYAFKVVREPLVFYRQRANSDSRNCSAMEQGYQKVLAKVKATVPEELKPSINQGYGFAYFCLAWKALQSLKPDYRLAKNYRQKALSYHPQRFFTKENLRLSFAIFLMQWFGKDSYSKFLQLLHSTRRRLTTNH
ncbi:MAG TPA: glycosyltransferase family 2 protein [Xenococcaceae cyanobacterium]